MGRSRELAAGMKFLVPMVVVTLVVAGGLVLWPRSSQSLQSRLPYTGITLDQPEQIYLEHAQQGTGAGGVTIISNLQADPSYAKLYFKNLSTLTTPYLVQIYDGVFTSASPRDAQGNRSEPGAVEYRFIPTDNSGNPKAESCWRKYRSNISKMKIDDWSDDINLSFGSACRPAKDDETGYYIVRFEADFLTTTPASGRVNAFKLKIVSSGANYVGFWSRTGPGDDPVAIQNKHYDLPDSHNDNYDIQFGTPCTVNDAAHDGKGEKTTLRWQDADHAGVPGAAPQDSDVSFELYDVTNRSSPTRVRIYHDTHSPGGVFKVAKAEWIGGQGDESTGYFYAKRDKDYEWRWDSIQRNNGLQIWVPYDSINYELQCPPESVYNNVPTFKTGPGYPFAGTVQPGQPYTIYANIENTGAASSVTADLLVWNQDSGVLVNEQDPPGSAAPIASSSRDYQDPTGANCATHEPCWWWRFQSPVIGSGQNTTGSFTFTVSSSATAADGPICFTAYARPHTPTDAEDETAPLCFPIELPTEPFVSTGGGDVHAGAQFGQAPCFNPADGSGRVYGNIDATGSKSAYVVSAGGSINEFGSADSLTTKNLTFGRSPEGYYGTICRQDLAADLLASGSVTIGDATYTIPPAGITRRRGNVTISGGMVPVGNSRVLVVDGDVLITGNISYEQSGYSATTIPSLGIYATGNIHIHHNVGEIYGIYVAGSVLDPHSSPNYADGIINTCQDTITPRNSDVLGVTPSPAISTDAGSCSTQLVVNGALVAQNIFFRRTGGDTNQSGSEPAEYINLLPQILLNPPFGATGLATSLRYEGERPPVF
ncbi:hypothetical protein HY346_01020 [Candidatus Microgenomates bacterium]|nr:hypothetical protein [Candidatus Microgenomates bacterium]